MERMIVWSKGWVACLGLVLTSVFSVVAQKEAFEHANALYESGNYEDALAAYEEILATNRNFTSEYNAGNAAYKLGAWGKARLHYERAKLLEPHDDNLTANLALLETKIVDKISAVPKLGLKTWVAHWFGPGHIRWWMGFAAWWWTLGWILLILRWSKSRRESQNTLSALAGVSLGLGVVGMVGMQTSIRATAMPQQVVVMQDRVDVLSTPNTHGTVLFQLHEGTKACILDVADGWKEIQLDNGNVGWISNDATEVV